MIYRHNKNKKVTSIISKEFYNAFKEYIKELGNKGYFYEEFKSFYPFAEQEIVKSKMVQELGFEFYYDSQKQSFSNDQICSLIEFYFKFVSEPLEWGKDERGWDIPIKFNKGDGCYKYTCRINELFENFRHPYRLVKGEIFNTGSEVLGNSLKLDFEIKDKELKEFIGLAINKFYRIHIEEKRIGLEKIVDALERLKSLKDSDKKKSIDKILNEVSKGNNNLKEILNNELLELNKIANEKYMIRHTEKDKSSINDPELIEYLFYRYFNIIRFILMKFKE